MSDTAEDTTEVLTFRLGPDEYCVDIDYVSEIVDGDGMTPIPDSEPHVEGVMDLRGQTTTIVNPCEVLDTGSIATDELLADGGIERNRIVVLDSEMTDTDSTTGWIVSAIKDVVAVSESALETEHLGDSELLHGLLKTEDGFTLWLDPKTLTA